MLLDTPLKNNTLLDKKINSVEPISFPMENIDTSWMTKAQKKFFEVLKVTENKSKKHSEICELVGYKSTAPWYKAIKDEKFTDLPERIGVKVKYHYPSHSEVEYIKNPKEREDYFKNDIWDMRRLFEEYPRHATPKKYIVNFNDIHNLKIRKTLKRYYVNMLSNWEPSTFHTYMKYIPYFFNTMDTLFPNISNFDELDRETHIEPILQNISCSKYYKIEGLKMIRAMFEYMYYNKWDNAPSLGLLNRYDSPQKEETLPRPILPNIKIQLDDYIQNTIIPLLENNKPTPIIESQYWDLIIVIRNTGRRFEDICHLIAEHNDKSMESLQYDLDEDPMLYLDHRIAKIQKDLRIPLAHLKDSISKGGTFEASKHFYVKGVQ